MIPLKRRLQLKPIDYIVEYIDKLIRDKRENASRRISNLKRMAFFDGVLSIQLTAFFLAASTIDDMNEKEMIAPAKGAHYMLF